MNDRTQAVKMALKGLSRKDAAALVKSFDLSALEEDCVLASVTQKSCVELSLQHHVSEETVKRARHRALERIANELNI